jgi:CheY-like chemotaxis protein
MPPSVLLLLDAEDPDTFAGWTPSPDEEGEFRPEALLGHVLVVDDEEIVRRFLTRLLEESGYDVRVARDGAEAWRMLEADPTAVDLVITDLRMPIMDGWQLGRRLREHRPSLPVLYVSGYDLEQSAPTPSSFLRKPFDPEELLRRVQFLLRAN